MPQPQVLEALWARFESQWYHDWLGLQAEKGAGGAAVNMSKRCACSCGKSSPGKLAVPDVKTPPSTLTEIVDGADETNRGVPAATTRVCSGLVLRSVLPCRLTDVV